MLYSNIMLGGHFLMSTCTFGSHLAMDRFFPYCLTLASCCFWDSCCFSATLPLFLISRRLLTTSVHALCYFAHSYTPLVALLVLFYSCTSSFLDLPVPLHSPFSPLFLVQPDQVFLRSRLYSRTHRDRTLYIFLEPTARESFVLAQRSFCFLF